MKKKETGDFRSTSDFLLGYFEETDGALLYRYDAERLLIEPWGENSFRVRAFKCAEMPEEDWALTIPQKDGGARSLTGNSGIKIGRFSAEITNGKLKARINNIGKLFFITTRESFCWRSM